MIEIRILTLFINISQSNYRSWLKQRSNVQQYYQTSNVFLRKNLLKPYSKLSFSSDIRIQLWEDADGNEGQKKVMWESNISGSIMLYYQNLYIYRIKYGRGGGEKVREGWL